MAPVYQPDSPFHDRILTPPYLDAQINELCASKVERIAEELLSCLQKLILSADKRERWFDILLTIMILLSDLEYLYQRQHKAKEQSFEPVRFT